MTDYVITQTERTLSSSTIKLVKYENKVSRLVFDLDGTIPEGLHLYLATCNPKTKKINYIPILYDNDTPYVIVSTEITYYTGKWQALLIGISPETYIDDVRGLDDSLIVWSSFNYNKIFVLETFLDDDNTYVVHANIEQAMDDLVALHENVVNISAQTGEDLTNCESILQQCQDILSQINLILSHMNVLESSMVNRYQELMANMQGTYSAYLADLRRERLGG